MEEPEIIKMLKYILLVSCAASVVLAHPLVKDTENPIAMVPVPFHTSDEQFSAEVTSSTARPLEMEISPNDKLAGALESSPLLEKNNRQIEMSPVSDIQDVHEELEQGSSGGQKHVREVPRVSSGPPGAPPPSDELGSLCSIFQFFLEPRRYSRCRVSNTVSESERNEELALSSPRGGLESDPGFGFNPNYHRPISNEVSPGDHGSSSDNFHSESSNREIESDPQRPILEPLPPPQMNLDHNRRGHDEHDNREPSASKRYDHLEVLQIHGHPEDESHHLVPPGPPPPPMFPKSSLDRTTIIVPERPCPRGERRDHKGYCRRIVRVRPSYQYGPPPPPYGPSRPIRYYYSRFVSVPTLQFFIPAVP